MLYKFKSKAAGDQIMLEPNGRRVLQAIGKDAGPKGIIQPPEMAPAIAALESAIAEEEAQQKRAAEEAKAKGEAAPRVEGERFHYFETGIKRLIIELELEDVAIFLVHLSLKFRHRHDQLRHLHELVKRATKPVIVAGDFNTFWGDHEIYLFMEASGLKSANRVGLPSYPSRNPRKELDFILYSNGIEITHFDIPDVRFSDHRPLICDFNVRRPSA